MNTLEAIIEMEKGKILKSLISGNLYRVILNNFLLKTDSGFWTDVDLSLEIVKGEWEITNFKIGGMP